RRFERGKSSRSGSALCLGKKNPGGAKTDAACGCPGLCRNCSNGTRLAAEPMGRMAACGRLARACRVTKKLGSCPQHTDVGPSMSCRTKLFWVFLITVLVSVSVVSYAVTYYSRSAFAEIDRERTEALVAQFQKEYTQKGEEIARQLDNIVNSELTGRMALD